MATFSTKERFIASFLSTTPGLKKFIKTAYICLNAMIYAREKGYKILDNRINGIDYVIGHNNQESFFGYYDKTPECSNNVLSHISTSSTAKNPTIKSPIKIAISNIINGKTEIIGDTTSYAWQQGARAQWIDDDTIIYNIANENSYQAVAYSLSQAKIVNTFDKPVQDSYGKEFFLSLNYTRLMSVASDYGYRNFPYNKEKQIKENEDGIWYVDYNSGKSKLLHSIEDVKKCNSQECFSQCYHTINHIMISPDGKGFIFIHRYYLGKRRFDRLVYSNFDELKVLADENMVSHMCWLNKKEVFGYLRIGGKNGYYSINIEDGEKHICEEMTNTNLGDGHPSVYKNWIVFDCYPDKSRMQQLLLFNKESKEIIPLLKLYQSVKYMYDTRCDLHPRFSKDGKHIYFDTVFSGKRTHCRINVQKIIK